MMTRRSIIRLLFGLCLVTMVGFSLLEAAEKMTNAEMSSASIIKQGVQSRLTTSPTYEELKQAGEEAILKLPDNHHAVKMIRQAIQETESDQNVKLLRQLMKQVHESITFRPIQESERPAGFPELTPLHVIQVKTYPEYRLAEVEMKKGEGRTFWTLFNHIRRNDIKMTAPVEIEYGSDEPTADEKTMAFLYRTQELGETGVDGEDSQVVVKDVPEMTVVSIGCKGNMNEKEVNRARTKLADWLTAHPEYEASGPLRKLGYNSPMVPSFMRYYEVQIPVQKKVGE